MKINPFTLVFCKEDQYLEPEYVASQFDKSLALQRISIVLLIVLYALFGFLDFYIVPEKKDIFWFIRYAVVCPFSFGVLLLTFTRYFKRYNNLSLFLMFAVCGFGIDFMILLADPPATYSYYAGLILILIGIHTLIRMRFTWAFAVSWLIIIFYEIIAIWLINTSALLLINNNFFIISANLICIFAGYSMERTFRWNFYLNHMLDREKEMTAQKNRELKERVKFQHDAEEALLKNTHEIEYLVMDRTLQLQQTQKKFQDLVEHINDLIFVIDDTGVVTYISPVVNRMFGYNPSEIIGKKFFNFLHKDDSEEVTNWFYNQPTDKVMSAEFRLRSQSGQYLWVGTSLRREGETDIGWVVRGVLRDITKEKKLENQLRQGLKMEAIGTLAGGIAHDFNNILYPILGYTEMLRKDIPEGSPFTSKLEGIYHSALRAADLVKQILTFSREQTTDLKPIKIQPVVEEALKLIRATIPATIHITRTLGLENGVVKADSTQIHQVIMNLATNAHHAMEETGGELKVDLAETRLDNSALTDSKMEPGPYACLTISDQGKGMNKELTDKIFDPFFTTKRKGKGTGMGLSVVHGIIKSMNGNIEVKSAPAKGTEFKIYLPLKEGSPEEQTVKTTPSRGNGERILLIDDEEAIVKVAKEMLIRLGYNVETFTSSVKGFEFFCSHPHDFDLVITDMSMPGLAGDKLATKLTNVRADIPVLLCTGFSETMSEEKVVNASIKGFLIKPIMMDDLAQKIRIVLDGQ